MLRPLVDDAEGAQRSRGRQGGLVGSGCGSPVTLAVPSHTRSTGSVSPVHSPLGRPRGSRRAASLHGDPVSRAGRGHEPRLRSL